MYPLNVDILEINEYEIQLKSATVYGALRGKLCQHAQLTVKYIYIYIYINPLQVLRHLVN